MNENPELIECGCQGHPISAGDPNRVILYGKTWHPFCALRETLKQIAHLKEQIGPLEKSRSRLIKIEKRIKEMHCIYCGREVGGNWEFFGTGVCCTGCVTECGGMG